MATLFIADLHLSGERPAIVALFLRFLKERARDAEALYILGDLFEVWLGDDAVQDGHRPVLQGLKELTERIPAYVLHGNRDFLLGAGFGEQTGCQLLPDPWVINLYGTLTLLSHGDALCTDDGDYQAFRRQVRDPKWQAAFLAQPPERRAALARQAREESQRQNQIKTAEIMDANAQAVDALLHTHCVNQLIHGHTHRPGVHEWTTRETPARRIVLGDWYEQASVLVCDSSGCRLEKG